MKNGLAKLLVIGAILMSCLTVQAQESVLTINTSSGFVCGRASYPEYCYNVPSSVGGEDGQPGKFWMDVYYNAYPTPNGFIQFNNVADLQQASITAATVMKGTFQRGLQSYPVITSMDVMFHGNTNEGGTYTGTGHFTFSYYYGSCSGRGCGVPLVQLIQTGTLTITYN